MIDVYLDSFWNENGTTGSYFNFSLNDGTKTNQKDSNYNYVEKKINFDRRLIRCVQVFHSSYIRGFKFLDKEFKVLYEIGTFGYQHT